MGLFGGCAPGNTETRLQRGKATECRNKYHGGPPPNIVSAARAELVCAREGLGYIETTALN